jgi:uncharacterized protein (TIGR03545 family)
VRLFRWKAIIPLAIVLVLLVLGWTLFADRLVKKLVEFAGTEVVGAKVELAAAHVRLLKGNVTLDGLQVTNPQSPMRNLVQVDQIVAQLNGGALLEKKVVVDTAAVRGVRFDTPRRTSGALKKPSPTTGLVTRRVTGWADAIPIPSLDLSGLGSVAAAAGISTDSLKSVGEARALAARADSMRAAFERDLNAANPSPTLDSARALAERLRGKSVRQLGVQGTRDAVASVRAILGQVRSTRDRLTALQQRVTSGLDTLRGGAAALDRARQADYAYAQRLVKVPSLATPDVSMALFGQMAIARVKPVLYWMGVAQQYMPAGLKPKPNPAPPRARMAGVDVSFPKAHTWPTFLLRHGDASLLLGGQTAATGAYAAWVSGVTTEPAVYGGPLRFGAERTAAARGPRELRVAGILDRSGEVPHDSVDALVGGVAFPAAEIAAAGARLEFPNGTVRLSLDRRGGTLDGSLRLTADGVRWVRTSGDTAAAATAALGSRAWVEGLIWRSVASVKDVAVTIRFSGRPDAPRLDVSSNVGAAVSAALQHEVGAEVARVQASVRARVDSIVGQQVAQAKAKLTALAGDVPSRLGAQQQQLQQVQGELERRLQDLGQVVPGVRLPGIPRP